MKGRMAEDVFALSQRAQGNEVKRTPVGCDFVAQRRDIFGRKIGKPETHEIKTGRSQLSEAQKRKQRQLKRNYKVHTYP
jgi:sRNA-binding protein